MESIRRQVARALQEAQRAASNVQWESRDPDALIPAIQAAERALKEIRGVIHQMREVIVEADLAAMKVEETLLVLRRERQIRLDKEYEYPSERPPVPSF
ncbi:MAG: hypothetical protein QN144_12165 [Armatimonadota bacterium]|nr:hypothetical protein [Armatimonadota bacterium]